MAFLFTNSLPFLVNLETPIRAPLPCSKEEKDVRDRGPIDFELPDLEKENEKPQAPAIDPFKAACSDALPPSSLYLFF